MGKNVLNIIKKLLRIHKVFKYILFWKKIPKERRKYFELAIGGILVLLIPMAIASFRTPELAEAAWFDETWEYRQRVDITNSGSAQTDYQVKITLDTATNITNGKIQSDCDDIRITDTNGKSLPHWIEGGSPGCNNSATEIWVKVPSIPTSGTTVYLYYGNGTAPNVEKPHDVFSFFDNFSEVRTDKYTDTTGTNTIVAEGYDSKSLDTQGDANDIRYFTNTTFSATTGYALKARMVEDSTDGGLFFETQNSANGYLVTSRRAGGTSAFQWYKRVSDSWTSLATHNSVSSWTSTEYRTLEIARTGGNTLAVWDNETAITGYTATTDTTYTSGGVGIRGSSQQTIDWLFVRKASATEPTIGSPATVEQMVIPASYYKLDDGAGTTPQDSSPNNYDGSFGGAPTWLNEDQCISGKCLSFDGTDDYVQMVSPFDVTNVTKGTFSGWIYLPATNAGRWIAGADGTLGVQYTGGAFGFKLSGCCQNYFASNSTALDNKWHYVAITFDIGATSYQIFVDGTLTSGTITDPSSYVNTGTHLRLGSALGGFSKVRMDDVRWYTQALTAAQIRAIYKTKGSSEVLSAQIGAEPKQNLSDSLVGYWKMDESSWTNDCSTTSVTDSSGNGNNGASCPNAGGVTTLSTGKFGNAPTLDGNNDYIEVADPSNGSLDFGSSTDFTLSAWVNATSVSNTPFIIDKRHTHGGATAGYTMYLDSSGRPVLRVGNGSTATEFTVSSGTYAAGSWYHYVISASRTGTTRFFVNGAQVATADISSIGDISGTTTLYLGTKDGTSTNALSGKIDEARIYKRALSSAEVSQLYTFAPGPVGYWKLDEGTSTSALDSSGNNQTGSLTSGPTWTTGKYGKAVNLDGSDDLISVINTTALNPLNVTVEAWAYFNSLADRPHIVGKGNGTAGAYWLVVETNGQPKLFYTQTAGTWESANGTAGDIVTGRWYHFAGTYDGTTARIYVDGVQKGSNADSGSLSITDSNALKFGRESGDTDSYSGKIDEVKIYNYARTSSQIVEDMNVGHPAGGSPVGSQTGYWKFDEGYGTTSNGSVNNYNVTLANGPMWIQDGKFGKALSFDGLNDMAYPNTTDPLDSNPYEFVGQDMSFSLWFNPNASDTTAGRIFSKPWNGNGEYNYGLILNTNDTLLFSIDSGTSWNSSSTTTTITNGVWQHLAVTIEGTTRNVKIYLNGRQILSETHTVTDHTPGSGDANLPFTIGTLYPYGPGWAGDTGHAVQGIIDEVKVYNSLLTADQIKVDMNQGQSQVLGALSTIGSTNVASSSAGAEFCVPGDSTSCAAPMMRWTFEEKTGTTINDRTGNANAGLLNGNTAFVSSKHGAGVTFDGTNDYVCSAPSGSCADDDDLDFGTSTDFTVSYWIKNLVSGSETVLGKKQHGGAAAAGFQINAGSAGNPTKTQVTISDGTNSITGNTLMSTTNTSDGVWHFITVTFDRDGNATMYVDGKQEDADSIATIGSISNAFAFYIGVDGDLNTDLTAEVDEVKIFNYLRTPAQIAWDYNRGAPVGHWKFDECTGTTANDASGNGNSGTITIGSIGTYTTAGTCSSSIASHAWNGGTIGKRNYSLAFDGSDDYTTVADNNMLDFGTGNFSASFWMYPTTSADGNFRVLISKGTNGAPSFDSYYHNGVIRFFVRGSGEVGQPAVDSSSLSINTWYHVVLVRNGTSHYIYLNGTLNGTGTNNGATIDNGSVMYIGGGFLQYFQGKLDDVKVYNYALTATQIRSLYSDGTTRFGPVTGAP